MTLLSRRRWLQIGSLGLSNLTLNVLRSKPALAASPTFGDMAAPTFGRAKRLVMLYLTGGAPQHDTFDPKPLAPAQIRGEFSPIETNVPGIQISEMFPRLATRMDRVTLIRSVTHGDTVHTSAGYAMLTGRRHPFVNAKSASEIRPMRTDHPSIGSILSLTRPENGPPTFVTLPEVIKDAAVNEYPGQNAGFLGIRHDPLLVQGSAASGEFLPPPIRLSDDVPLTRLAARRSLLDELNRPFSCADPREAARAADSLRERANSLVTSNALSQAFDLDQETRRARDRYGAHLFGQSCLMARRLLEAGVGLVTVYWHYEGPDDSPVWDTHGNNFAHLRNRLAPPTDAALSSLLDDLTDRGMLDDTLVVMLGEFGRAPKINGAAGRDHWPGVATVVLAGAGIRAGAVYGASDRMGATPKDSPVTPADLTATLLHLLGVPPNLEIHDRTGRPYLASEGTPALAALT